MKKGREARKERMEEGRKEKIREGNGIKGLVADGRDERAGLRVDMV